MFQGASDSMQGSMGWMLANQVFATDAASNFGPFLPLIYTAPGGAVSLAVVDAGTSTDTGALGYLISLLVADAGTSGDAGALGLARLLAVSDAGSSTDAGAASINRGLATADAGTSADAGDLRLAVALAVADGGSSDDVALVLAVLRALAVVDPGLSTDVGALLVEAASTYVPVLDEGALGRVFVGSLGESRSGASLGTPVGGSL